MQNAYFMIPVLGVQNQANKTVVMEGRRMIIFEKILIGREGKGAFWGAGNVLHIDLSSGFTGVYMCQKSVKL